MTGGRPHRLARMNAALRVAVAEVLGEVREEILGLVSVVEVRTAPDKRNATVYISVYGDAAAVQASCAALDRAWGFIAGEVVRRVPMRRAPHLIWRLDETIAHADRIDRLLKGATAPEVSGDGSDD